jgi:tRNA A-37 threonylcarbamoyl transferase component Bud32/dienelactone hydrolase
MPLAPGTRLGPYEIIAPLGAGGMGEVYRARDKRLGRDVAIKVLPEELARDAELVSRLDREARAVAALNHPNIVVLHSIEEHEGIRFLTMEFVEGESLDRHVTPGGLPIPRVLEIGTAIADALTAAHEKGVVHRDLKPANVMVARDGRIKVLDFGLAKLATTGPSLGGTQAATMEAPLSTTGAIMGTVPYMAPEQIRGERVDARTDLFALGIVLYELAAGRRPFEGRTAADVSSAILRDTPAPLTSVRAGLTGELDRVVRRCLEKSPDARFQTALELAAELRRAKHALEGGTVVSRRRLVPVVVIGALVLLGAGVWIAMTLRQSARVQWARAALPRITALADSANAEGAWSLAPQVQSVLGDDPALQPVWPRISRIVNMSTEPSGARASRRALAGPDTAWHTLGTTPLDSIRVPAGAWIVKFEKEGFRPLEALVNVSIVSPTNLAYGLDAGHGPTADMACVPTGVMQELNLPGYEALGGVTLETYWIDLHEITNQKFKAFVDAGGYRRRELWDEPFVLDGRPIGWDAAIARFTDHSGRPGPATWEAGDFPAGQADFPVSGVSWYEASAYAKFAGKSLPTIFHWVRAARTTAAAFIVPRSNFDGRGTARVGSYAGLGPYGTLDMAGNVREWCANAAGDTRYILGGGWNDPGYAFADAYTQAPFDRSPTNGIRLVHYRDGDSTLAFLGRPVFGARARDLARERPVGDAIFAAYRRLYDYDPAPLNATVEARDTTAEDYVQERVTFAAAYGGERVTAYLYLPRHGRPPYQTVVFFPGSNALNLRTFDATPWVRSFDFMLKSGRAVIMPIYKSTFERGDGYETDITDQTIAYRDHVIMWAKDFRRSVDYLATRADVDTSRLAYYGISWGGHMGGIIPAVEPRVRSVILYVAGLGRTHGLPEVESLNFLPRVTQPVLMLNGRFDHYFPVETSQKPFFRMLGTPADRKRQVISDGGHFVPRNQLIGESLDWLDHTLGPAR